MLRIYRETKRSPGGNANKLAGGPHRKGEGGTLPLHVVASLKFVHWRRLTGSEGRQKPVRFKVPKCHHKQRSYNVIYRLNLSPNAVSISPLCGSNRRIDHLSRGCGRRFRLDRFRRLGRTESRRPARRRPYRKSGLNRPTTFGSRSLFKAASDSSPSMRARPTGLHHVTSIIISVDDEPERWGNRWPKGHVDHQGRKVRTEFRYSSGPTKTSKAIYRTSAPLPGSMLAGETVCWRPWGKPPADLAELGLEDLEARALAATNMESICRSIAYATLLYWIEVNLDGLTEWDGSLTRIVGGWLAKIVPEGMAINAAGKSPGRRLLVACRQRRDTGQLVAFLLKEAHAPKELGVAFIHAAGRL